MATLSVTFGKELSQPLTDIYWEALKSLAIEQVEQSAKSAIRHCKHFPKPAELFERWQDLQQAAPKPAHVLPPFDRKWLALVNGMFLKYLLARRIEQGFVGDIDIQARRAECLKLVEFFESIEAEGDEEATEPQMKIRFDKAIARGKDKSTTKDWLAAQLEFQKQQDRERARA